jgi:hypothetical protein
LMDARDDPDTMTSDHGVIYTSYLRNPH